jgi:hypothetical protein
LVDIPVELYPMAFVVGAACVGAGFGESSFVLNQDMLTLLAVARHCELLDR